MSRDALVVGINSYQSLKDLKAPAVDAEAIAQRLEQDGDFRKVVRLPEAIKTGDNQKKAVVSEKKSVSQQKLEKALKSLFLANSDQIPETALFYFSGHGLTDEEGYDKGYLATSDTDPKNPRSGLSLRWLQWLLSESKVKQQIIWLDCCHSGALIVNVGAANPGNSESRDRCFIASSRDFESSWSDINSQYSVLTKALLDGLDPRRLRGEWIDTFSLVDYVNKALRGELQTPVCTNFGEAINLTRAWQTQVEDSSDTQADVEICPYKGLEYFDCNDTDPQYFFGRDRLVSQLLDQVRTSNFMALVGASGNGKSSVLRAGLLHQIKIGRRIAGSDQWRIRITRPDKQPMQNLALAFVDEGLSDLDRAEALGRASGLLKEGGEGLKRLIQASSAPKSVLVIDQFEEVFTRCEDIEEREHYFDCLMGALSGTDDKLCLIIAMRADFVGKCLEYEYSGLAQQIKDQMTPVLPMKPDELKEVICKPAEQVGLTVEPTLVTEILNDIAGAPGSLPLLQYTLKVLYQKRQGNQLVLTAYQALGGITGTLDKRATDIYNNFNKDQQLTVQHIFQQLTQLGEGTKDTRRRVFQADLVAEPKHSHEQVKQVLETLSSPENRLLVTSEVVSKNNTLDRMAIVDVAHEALIQHWKLLRQWIEQNRDLLRQQRRIEANAITWRSEGKNPGYLLQGLPLAEAKQFQNNNNNNNFPLSDVAHKFIQKSAWNQRLNKLKYTGWLIIPALIVVGLVERSIHETNFKETRERLAEEGTYEERQAVLTLVQGCRELKETGLPHYLSERIHGYCRTLVKAPLINADLRSAVLIDVNLNDANLSSADLRSADLSSAVLIDANLNEANLSSAVLIDAVLIDAVLIDADLNDADLNDAVLSSAVLSSAVLIEVSFSSADLSSANLRFADLRSANLRFADLRSANLRFADLTDANLHYANLTDASISFAVFRSANLLNTNLHYANLTDASISFAVFRSANLLNTNLRSADLTDANLHYANLRYANLRYANLSSADLSSADLSSADLSSATLITTDFRNSKNLTTDQLSGGNQPYLCNVALPDTITDIDPNRDCGQMSQILRDRYPWISLEKGNQIVKEAKAKTWD